MKRRKWFDDCDFEGCGRTVHARGFCVTHWTQWKKGDALTPIRKLGGLDKSDTCAARDCTATRQRGYIYCPRHSRQCTRERRLPKRPTVRKAVSA